MDAEAGSRPHVCFVAPHAYAAVSGRDDLDHIGGSETQQVLIARGLASRGFSVTFVTHDEGQPDGIVHEGIRVVRTCADGKGLPGLRFVHPRWTSLCRALSRVNADVYYQRTAGVETGQVALWCRRHHAPFVFGCASNSDCDPKLPYLKTWRERAFYRFGLRAADAVVAQTTDQVSALRRGMGVESVLIRNCGIDPARQGSFAPPRPPDTPTVLWIGRFSYEKRPEMVLELARACPDIRFMILGGPKNADADGDPLTRSAVAMSNVTLCGRVPRRSVGDFYRRCSLLVCTSLWEGFPNTFIEAWSYGRPTVSTVDPDGMIEANHLGGTGADVDALKCVIDALVTDEDRWRSCSANARRHFERHHGLQATVDAYERLFLNVVRRGGPNAAHKRAGGPAAATADERTPPVGPNEPVRDSAEHVYDQETARTEANG